MGPVDALVGGGNDPGYAPANEEQFPADFSLLE